MLTLYKVSYQYHNPSPPPLISSNDFTLPPGLVTLHEAQVLIELFRQGGKLSALSVHKLLRLAYTCLKPQGNVRKLQLVHGDKMTVVGDLHGRGCGYGAYHAINIPYTIHIIHHTSTPYNIYTIQHTAYTTYTIHHSPSPLFQAS
ncbi:hypothetical protein EON64_12405 [archaeon]|nr:MAG: hypothetical protein EON64_12405 [archaeon]